jgi:hypothetical protein
MSISRSTKAGYILAKNKSRGAVFGVQFLYSVNKYIRKTQRGRGDLSFLTLQGLKDVDLGSVPLITIQGQRRQVTAPPTKIVLPVEVRDELHRWSKKRSCSVNELLNSALVASFPLGPRAEKSRRRWPRRLVSLSKMTAQEREDFLRWVTSLTGEERGPNLRTREGSYFEWDPRVEATVEVAADGKRYLMGRVGPGEIVRFRELKERAFVERTGK